MFIKTHDTACGAVGVFVYDLQRNHEKKNIAIMFSVPYNYNHFQNVYALGISDETKACDRNLFNEMYYNDCTWFTRVNADVGYHDFKRDGFAIKSKMVDSSEATLMIDIMH